jgi:tRNA threonylcarbamoyladenosine biosynthesis protein TsaB
MILFIDSSTEKLRLWLKNDDFEVNFEKTLGREMAKNILVEIKEFLAENGANWQNLRGICVFAGPGSFTGLRIGVTVANTLADSLKIPIVGEKNSDNSKNNGENLENWREIALEKLNSGADDKIALPFYGAEANITKPRK